MADALLARHPRGVVAHSDEQLAGDLDADTERGGKGGVHLHRDERGDELVQVGNLDR
ncbi:MAG: hypothetical protein U5Q44_00445 [Dehalococcoidia bacterium]|nr:hypothetical protein [Dehalococcoidia bacterium]